MHGSVKHEGVEIQWSATSCWLRKPATDSLTRDVAVSESDLGLITTKDSLAQTHCLLIGTKSSGTAASDTGARNVPTAVRRETLPRITLYLFPTQLVRALSQQICSRLAVCATELRGHGHPTNGYLPLTYFAGFSSISPTLQVVPDARVFVSPPYSKVGRPGDWCKKAVAEAERLPTTQILMLLPVKTDTRWIRPLDPYPRVLIRGRVRFKTGAGQKDYGCGMFPSMVVALNVPTDRLATVFGEMGTVYVPYAI